MTIKMGEVISKRSLNAKHYLNIDGTYTAEISGVPIHYLDGEQYKDCELTILPERNWEFEYAVKKNNFRAYFNDATDIENYTLASFEIVNSQGISRWINYKLFGATPTEDIVADNTILYKNCFENVDLKYYVDTWRLKEDIIINAPVKNFEYEFSLKLDGARLEQQEDGSILFIDIDTEEILWRIEKPYATDADDKTTYGVNYVLGKVIYEDIEYDSIKVKIVDTEFLNDAVYPIVIDPTTTNFTSNYCGYVERTYSAWSSYPDSWSTQNALSSNFVCESNPSTTKVVKRGLVSFDLSLIPVAATIQSVKIRNNDSSIIASSGTSFGVAFYKKEFGTIDVSDWSLGTLVKSMTLAERQNKTFFDLPVSSIIAGQINGFQSTIYPETTPSVTERMTLINPTLEILYNNPPTTPIVTAPNGGETYNASATITWTASTDPDADALTYEIDYSTNNGGAWTNIATGLTGTSYAWNCSAVPASNLCLVRIRAKDSGGLYSAYDQSNAVFTIRHNFGKKIMGVQAPAKIMGSVAMKVLGNS